MKPIAVVFILMGCVALASCQGDQDTLALALQFEWVKQNECSEFSPEIRVIGIPPGTRHLEVCLTDLYMPGSDHGGWGRIPCPENGIIAPGAIKHFRGPCPPKYYGHGKYEFTIRSLDKNGMVTGVGKLAKKCCPHW
jgi:hypothetical protein